VSERKRPRDPHGAITSAGNERIRYVKSLYRTTDRRRERLFVVEGVRLLEEALAAGARPELVLVAPEQLERTPRGAALLDRLTGFSTWQVTDTVLKTLSETVTPQGAIALFPIPEQTLGPATGPIVLVLDGLRDPGNAGTILRSAQASGVVRTVAFVDSVDAYSPKVVRAAMGAHFRLTILEDAHFPDLLPRLGRRPLYLAVAEDGIAYDRVRWTEDCALIVGGEAEGAGPEAIGAATHRVTIPMAGPTESLNAAMAGTILLFEAARARRTTRPGSDATEAPMAADREEPRARPPFAPPPRRPRSPADTGDRPERPPRSWDRPRERDEVPDRGRRAPFGPRRGGEPPEDEAGPRPPWSRPRSPTRPGGRTEREDGEAPFRRHPPGPPPRDRDRFGGDEGPRDRRPPGFGRPGRPPDRDRGPGPGRPRRPKPFRPEGGPPSDRPRKRPKE
jgi:RNA methyltransferase, TrmH family